MKEVLVVGAGLSGLLAAYRLEQAGIPTTVLEGSDRLGGRIHTLEKAGQAPVEMGATWMWRDNVKLFGLLKEFDIPYFQQYNGSAAFFQPAPPDPIERIPIPPQEPSFRIAGGTSRIIRVLANRLEKGTIRTGQAVKRIEIADTGVRIFSKDTFEARRVIITAPPKLWAAEIEFSPSLPDSLLSIAQNTQTWMEESIKVALTYPAPFWKENGSVATLFSQTGPVVEFYDQTDAEEKRFALCGFMSPDMINGPAEKRKSRVIEQLSNIYGPQAADFLHYRETVWREEPFTSNKKYLPLVPHQNNGHAAFQKAYFDDRLFFANTETSVVRSGYMEGAVLSAYRVVRQVQNLDPIHMNH